MEQSKVFLKENPDLTKKIEEEVKAKIIA